MFFTALNVSIFLELPHSYGINYGYVMFGFVLDLKTVERTLDTTTIVFSQNHTFTSLRHIWRLL